MDNEITRFSYETAFNVDSVRKLVSLLDDLSVKLDVRIVGDNTALLCAFFYDLCRQLSPPRRGPQYRLFQGELRWSPFLDIESLQLGFMRSTASHMWNVYAKGRVVEEQLGELISIPAPLTANEAESAQKCSERVALMYMSQLVFSAKTTPKLQNA